MITSQLPYSPIARPSHGPRKVAVDGFGRRVDYLRISVTDRCNLRCTYCMPSEGLPWTDPNDLLKFDEIERFTAAAVDEGISKIRLTGGEPLARRGIADLVHRLRRLDGVESIALTTNGTLLPRMAAELAAAGLERVNISLVSLDPEVYSRVTRGGSLADALAGMDAAFAAGMTPIKVNVVVMRSLEQDLLSFARLTMDRPIHVRFIEYMPIGGEADCRRTDGGPGDWTRADRLSSNETLARLRMEGAYAGFGELAAADDGAGPEGWGPATYYRFEGAAGTIGVISPLSHAFCDRCNRLRLTADGKVRTCLFSDDELDARHVLRHGTDAGLHSLVRAAIAAKPESRNGQVGTVRRMSQIGG
jgi:cyclic pyranopterin phosphate synthase